MTDRDKTLLEKVQAVCLAEGVPEPDEFLAQVMAGVDPRFDASPLYKLVKQIESEIGDEPPSREDWVTLKNLVLSDPGYKPVRIEHTVSIRAAERLMDHLYPKLKAIDVTGEGLPQSARDLEKHELAEVVELLRGEY